MSTPSLSDLPDEILEKIFKNLNDYYGEKTIKNLTEVCSRFNDIIGANPDLVKNLTVYWNSKHKDINVLLASNRKYQKISIKKIDKIDANLMEFLKKNPIADISLQYSSFTIEELTEMLKAIGNTVVELELDVQLEPGSDSDLELSNDSEQDKKISLNFPKLEKLQLTDIDCVELSSIFNLFEGAANIREFKYIDKRQLRDYEISHFSHMLASFDSLKSLELETYQPYFFDDDYLAKNAKFSLKKYSHESSDGDFGIEDFEPMEEDFANGCVHLMTFLNGQRASLESLRINRYPITSEIIDSIMAMDKLDYLSLFKCTFRASRATSVKNTSIKTLLIGHFTNYDEEYRRGDLDRDTEIGYTAILSNCSNVESLNLFDFDVTSGISMCISIYMKNLESISFLSNPRIFPMTYASVKTMDFTVDRFMDYNDILKLLQVNQQLKVLHLSGGIQDHPNYSATIALLNLDKLDIFDMF